MAINKCPHCSQVTLSLGAEISIKCPICETVFEVNSDKEEEHGKQ